MALRGPQLKPKGLDGRSRGEPQLEWFQDPERRELTGWYLQVPGEGSRRLSVDPMIDALAGDEDIDAASWERSATAVAGLTEALAISRARKGRFARRAPAEAEPRLYELYVADGDEALIAGEFSAVTVVSGPEFMILTAVLDEPALRLINERLAALGCRLLGVATIPAD